MSEREFSPPSMRRADVLGEGWGLDHVAIVVRDLPATEERYRSRLGFVISPGGSFPHFGDVRNSLIGFGQTYIEIITVDPAKAVGLGATLAGFLQNHEGGLIVGLDVSSAQQTAGYLRERGLAAVGPVGGTITLDTDTATPPERWRYVNFEQPVVPADAIFFLEYDQTEGIAIQTPPAEHPNTAQRIASVWMAVENLDAATAAYESIGLPAGRPIHQPQLGAAGREIEAGQGVIWLLEAIDGGGAVASFLAQRGAGVIGMGVEVASLDSAYASLAGDIQQQIRPYPGTYGRSLLLNPDLTNGIWIELFQPAE